MYYIIIISFSKFNNPSSHYSGL